MSYGSPTGNRGYPDPTDYDDHSDYNDHSSFDPMGYTEKTYVDVVVLGTVQFIVGLFLIVTIFGVVSFSSHPVVFSVGVLLFGLFCMSVIAEGMASTASNIFGLLVLIISLVIAIGGNLLRLHLGF